MKNRHSPGCRCCGGYSTHVSCQTCNIPRVNLTYARRLRAGTTPWSTYTLVYNPTDIYGFPVWESAPVPFFDGAFDNAVRAIIRAACSEGVLSWWVDCYSDTACTTSANYVAEYEYAGSLFHKQTTHYGLNYKEFAELTANSCTPFDVSWWWSGVESGTFRTYDVRIYE